MLGIIMVCSAIIGLRVYLEINSPPQIDQSLPPTGQYQSAPDELPAFSLNDLEEQSRNISEWSDQPLLINFWATWCAPCRREIPLLQQLHVEKNIHGIQVIGIAIDRLDDVGLFLAEYGVTYPNLVGEADAIEVSSLFGLDGLGLPFSVLSGADGKVLTVHIGEIDGGQLAELVAILRAYENNRLSLKKARSRLAGL